jgi:glyoxylase-like metal-dependent hydrolase (beta-lactamase superfamily II)
VGDPDKAYTNEVEELVPGSVWAFRTVPNFGIGQRAFVIRDERADGQLVMWDCIGYLDDATLHQIDKISGGKGIKHMVISHPHFFTTSAIWSAAFPEMTLWLAEPDFSDWYQRRDIVDSSSQPASAIRKRIRIIQDTKTSLGEGSHFSDFTIYKLGGHFPGSLVLHWKDILFVADTLAVIPSGFYKSEEPRRPGIASVSFLWR